jgi:AcrR family transcriptional regulator
MSRAHRHVSDGRSSRVRIEEAAAELFARDGFDRTPTSRIAAEADVPQGLIFYHFGTKRGLLLSLVHHHTNDTLAEIEVAVNRALESSTEHDVGAILGAVRGVLDSGVDTAGRVRRIVFQELAAYPEIREQAQLLHGRAVAVVADGLRAHPAARARADDGLIGTLARMLVGTELLGAMFYEHGDPVLDPARVATIVTRALNSD